MISLRILVADADPAVKTAVRLFLGQDAPDVLDAMDGERALFILRTIPLDLVLVDVLLPKLDGLELLRIVRSEPTPRLRSTAFVLLASNATPDLAARARTHGANEVLQKPLSTAGIAALLNRAQKRRESGASWKQVRAAPNVVETTGQPSTLPPPKRGG